MSNQSVDEYAGMMDICFQRMMDLSKVSSSVGNVEEAASYVVAATKIAYSILTIRVANDDTDYVIKGTVADTQLDHLKLAEEWPDIPGGENDILSELDEDDDDD